jgi:signal transduction histidine kinase
MSKPLDHIPVGPAACRPECAAVRRRTSWARFGIVLGIWASLAVVLTGQACLVIYSALQAESDLPRRQPTLAFTEVLWSTLVECLSWAVLTLGILWLVRRFPFGQGRWLRSLLVHVGACVLCACLEAFLSLLAAELIRRELPRPTLSVRVLVYFFVVKLNNNIFFYWAIVAVGHVLNYYRQLRDRELLASQLEARLAQTQLQALKVHLHPHFLFNTLNAISALVHQDVERADRMIARLGDLLRAALENANQQEVPLKQELDFLQPYLEIEQARLGPRLTVDLRIDPAVMDARVPNRILQPLVENAIRHGIGSRAEPGHVQIQAYRDNGFLHLAVKDTGPGLPASPGALPGIGLANTHARLEQLYGVNQSLDLSNSPEGGLRVRITIPFHEFSGEPAVEVS